MGYRRNDYFWSIVSVFLWACSTCLYLTFLYKLNYDKNLPNIEYTNKPPIYLNLSKSPKIFPRHVDVLSPEKFLNIVIFSDSKASARRESLRNSWLKSSDYIDYKFLMKKPTRMTESFIEEQETQNDLLIFKQGSPTEPHFLTYIKSNKQKSEYTLFIPDDTYVNLAAFESRLRFGTYPHNFVMFQQDLLKSNFRAFPLLVDNYGYETFKKYYKEFKFPNFDSLGLAVFEEPAFCTGLQKANNPADICNPFNSDTMLLRGNTGIREQLVLNSLQKKHVPKGRFDEDKVTIVIKHTSKFRSHYLVTLIESIRKYYPQMKLIVADDSPKPEETTALNFDGVLNRLIYIPEGSGLSYGRNALVEHVDTEYTLLIDDDNIFWKNTKIDTMLKILENTQLDKRIDLVGGVYHDISDPFIVGEPNSYALDYLDNGAGDLLMVYSNKRGEFKKKSPFYKCRSTDTTHNFFLARTSALKKSPWRDNVIMSEHELFFLDFKKNGFNVMECPEISILHDKQVYPTSEGYKQQSKRFSSFCPAFREMCQSYPSFNTILTPWHEVQCQRNFVCHIFGSYTRGEQLNTKDTDWRHDPIRRIFCMDFSDSLCSFDADPVAVEKAGMMSALKKGRKRRPSQRQKDTRPADYMTIQW